MTLKSLIGMILLVGAAVIVSGVCSTTQADPKTGKAEQSLADLQKQADNWQLRAVAMDSLITFESVARKRFKG
jgi:hypothetical protein